MKKDDIRLKKNLTALLGEKNCLFAIEDRWTYAFDASRERAIPGAVVFPSSPEQVAEVMRYAVRHGLPVVPRGGGSGLTGGAVPTTGGIVMVLERLNRILEIDADNLCAVVETGVITAHLQEAADRVGLFYPPDPASRGFSTIGGNIAENAGGMRAVKYGVTKQYVLGLDVVLPNGDFIRLGSKCIKDVAGYSLTELFVGSEGTLGIITRAILKLLPRPETVRTMAVCFKTIHSAGRAVPLLLQNGVTPCTLEFIDHDCLEAVTRMLSRDGADLQIHGDTGAMLLIELDGPAGDVDRDAAVVREICAASGMLSFRTARTPEERDVLWHARRSIHGAIMGLCPEWLEEDISVPPAAIPAFLDRLARLADDENLRILSFGHYGDGNIHLSISEKQAPLAPERAEVVRKAVFEETVALGGRIAAEHGIGSMKKEYLDMNLNEAALNLAVGIKKLLDPRGVLNPNKVFPRHVWDRGFPR